MSTNVTTINPATGKEIKTYELMTEEQTLKAVEKCHDAFTKWKATPIEERGKIIQNIGEKFKEQKEEFAQLMTEEMGKIIAHGNDELDLCAAICEYTAATGAEELADEEKELAGGGKGIVSYSPLGVIYGIQPWNFPAYQVVRYSIVNLMAGNGILLKHAANVTGSALKLKEIYEEAGLPKDLFSVLIIDHDVSEKIIEHDLVRGVTFTGSAGAGRKIGEQAGKNIKKTVLELGSNDAYIVLEDADVELAIKTCTEGRIYNNGETCVAAKRFIVVDAVYDQFKKGFVESMNNIKLGDPTDENTQLGPMARKDLREKIHNQVKESIENGAEVLCGGEIPEGDGYYYPSTVLGNVKPGQPAYDDELFGPVASLIKAKDQDDAMRIANDSRFGLGGGIFSKDEDKAIELAQNHFDTGMVFINSFGIAQVDMPFGGVKNSGFGREHGGFGIKEFVNAKGISILK
ncbi:succinate-semialdehyde dehydrogenase/glutarate-semialdehyde dehydrogenase [Nonlabens xylanidelens]|uniref:Succinate-semialdehyde dehydrogenase/glutarate-semialdehyde dehydrogenase n=1 Tax=Nonlabens xylanidelens TaxID=191564 RepID=A0A2S6III4_9FLAO|nr:NAD-dependent succinate-semialdehyde dehydrogenase [Nonlabens xylanidelens]PPK94029.1 succinate-semialdehyde dehydrogenase/glutarate-semialdehyde dehydrogenase [Nonlabens xylanidelens]PQJ22184.1 succinate-semialdehyde dehydrogenase [Nonlabens xylanidelens]